MNLNDLFTNKLFLQYLTAGGSDLLSGNPFGTNVNAVTNQNIASQNFMKLMQQLLSGDETKATIGKDGMKLQLPAAALTGGAGAGVGNAANIGNAEGNIGAGAEAGALGTLNTTPSTSGGANSKDILGTLTGLLNPFL